MPSKQLRRLPIGSSQPHGRSPDVGTRGVYLFPGDEKGVQDFVATAFRLFGWKVESLHLLYLAILATSVVLHLACFERRPAVQAFQLVVLAAILATVPALPITSELGSVLNPRAFGLLAFPATASLMCLVVVGEMSLWQLPLFALQASIVAFVVHVRNDEAWQLGAPCILAAGMSVLAWHRRAEIGGRAVWRRQRHAGIAVVLLVVGPFFSAQAAIRMRLAPEYLSSKLAYKIFWHNVGIGFSVSPYFRKTYDLALSDTSFLTFVARSPEVAAKGEVGRRVFWAGTYTGRWVGGDPEIAEASAMYYVGMVRDFSGYEAFARQVVMRLADSHPWWTVRLLLYDKPMLMVRQLINAVTVGAYTPADLMLEDQSAALADDGRRVASGIYLRPISLLSMMAVAIFGVWLMISREASRWSMAAASAVLLVGSTSPLIATYPLIHLMASFLACTVLMGLVGVALIGSAVFEQAGAAGR